MSCSLEHDSTHSNGEITVVIIITKDKLTDNEKNLLRRHVWGWSNEQCIEPLSVKIEEVK